VEHREGPTILFQDIEGEPRVVPESHTYDLEGHGLEILGYFRLQSQKFLHAQIQQVGEGVI
jgi:hypothetical protein